MLREFLSVFLIVIFNVISFSIVFVHEVIAEENVYYIHSDHLGSVTLITDAGGDVVSQRSYYPYGEKRASFSESPTERLYTSQVSDTEQADLYYYNARYYDPEVTLYTQGDSDVGPNRYLYTFNNPIKFNDPTGKQSSTVNQTYAPWVNNQFLPIDDAGPFGYCDASGYYPPSSNYVAATATPEPYCYNPGVDCSTPSPSFESLPSSYFASAKATQQATVPVAAKTPRPSSSGDSSLNLGNRITGKVGRAHNQILDFWHQTDEKKPPQFSTLVQGNPYPEITGAYNVVGATEPIEYSLGSQNAEEAGPFAPVISLNVGKGAQIMVPYSAHQIDVGRGMQAMVIYIGGNNIAINYGNEKNIAGYTVYISGINIRGNLKVGSELAIKQIIGTAAGSDIFVGVTDNETWWDPRWRYDWWDWQYIP